MAEVIGEEDQSDRIAWLRERGVEIDLPNERNKSSIKTLQDEKYFVKIVKIPCDSARPYEEISIPIDNPETKTGDQLISLLSIYFRGHVDVDSIRQAASKQFANQSFQVSPDTIEKLAAEGNVEAFPLSFPSEKNHFQKISLYLDEAGQLKKLPPNQRAIALANTCGFKDVPLVGDMFIGRLGMTPQSKSTFDLKNIDFTIQDLDSHQEWLQNIEKLNYEHGLETNRVVMDTDEKLPSSSKQLNQIEGMIRNDVTWSQTKDSIEIQIQLPSLLTKFTAKDILVQFHSKSVTVKVKNTTTSAVSRYIRKQDETAGNSVEKLDSSVELDQYELCTFATSQMIPLLSIPQLFGNVSVEDCTWTINGHIIEITMEKMNSTLWDRLEKN